METYTLLSPHHTTPYQAGALGTAIGIENCCYFYSGKCPVHIRMHSRKDMLWILTVLTEYIGVYKYECNTHALACGEYIFGFQFA